MKILVAVKRALDYAARVRVKPDGSGIDAGGARHAVNPFCEIALEEAIRLKEAGTATEVVAVSVGPKECQEQLRTALALGADRVLHVDTGASPAPGPRGVAAALARVVADEGPRLVLLGKQAIDDDANATGQMLAGMLAWPQATFASRIVVQGEETATVTREVDGGLRTLSLTLPAVVTADLRLNTPRYASLPAVMKAKKAAVPVTEIGALGAAVAPQTRVVKLAPPPGRKAGVKVESAAELVDKLKHEARVL